MTVPHQLAVALAAVLALSACSVFVADPSVEVTSVELTGIGIPDQRLAVTLCVTNPNRSELNFARVITHIDIAGSPLAAGASDVAVKLPPLSSTSVPFTVAVTVENLIPQLAAIVSSGAVDYRVHGSVSLLGGVGMPIPYSRSGRLDVLDGGQQLAQAALDATPSRCAQQDQATSAGPL